MTGGPRPARAGTGPEPVVSVIIPTYNRLEYLKKALMSVQAQSFGDWELTIVDDGSTDGSAECVELLGDSRVRVERQEHYGNPARIRNVGLRLFAGGTSRSSTPTTSGNPGSWSDR